MKLPRIVNVLILLSALSPTVLSMPNPDKSPPEEINTIGKGDVGVSWGGYSASAGLGRGSTGGVLHAGAYAPGVGASAGLGGYVGGQAGGHAGAGAPSASAGGAAAGVAGGVAEAGAGATTGGSNYGPNYGQTPCADKNCQGNGFFDGIFNIPISVLKAVNSYLNQKGQAGTSS